jgi:hypothetical protein
VPQKVLTVHIKSSVFPFKTMGVDGSKTTKKHCFVARCCSLLTMVLSAASSSASHISRAREEGWVGFMKMAVRPWLSETLNLTYIFSRSSQVKFINPHNSKSSQRMQAKTVCVCSCWALWCCYSGFLVGPQGRDYFF